MRNMLSINEEYRRFGLGCDVDPSSESHLCGLHHFYHLLDGRAALYAYAGNLGHRHRRSSGRFPPKVPMGLLVVVLCICPGWSTRLLFHFAALFLLAHGRLFVGNDASSEWE